MIVVYTVTASEAEAERIGRLALEAGLCACVNRVPGMRSMYLWNGQIGEAQECILLLKTLAEKYDALETFIRKEHTYEVPAIFALPADRVEAEYAAWLKKELK